MAIRFFDVRGYQVPVAEASRREGVWRGMSVVFGGDPVGLAGPQFPSRLVPQIRSFVEPTYFDFIFNARCFFFLLVDVVSDQDRASRFGFLFSL